MLIIPAIDLKDGRCVRLRQGKAEDCTVYSNDPVTMAKRWVDEGAARLHVVDLDGAFQGKPVHYALIEKIVAAAGIPVEVGGGLRTDKDVQQLMDCGAACAIVGTRAFSEPERLGELAERFGGLVAVGIDARDGKVQVKGWVETTSLDAVDLAEQADRAGIRTLIVTDTAVDGMLSGPNVQAMAAVCNRVGCAVIASGGVSSPGHVRALLDLQCPNLTGVIVGKALYDGTTHLADLSAGGVNAKVPKRLPAAPQFPDGESSTGRAPVFRRPLVGLAVLYVLGTALGLHSDIPPGGLLCAAVMALCIAWLSCCRRSAVFSTRLRSLSLYLAVVLVAWLSAALRGGSPAGATTLWTAAERGVCLEVVGLVRNDPRGPVGQRGRVGRRALIQVQRFRTDGGRWHEGGGRVTVVWHGAAWRGPSYGDVWRFSGTPWVGVREVYLHVGARDGVRMATGRGNALLAGCFTVRHDAARRLALGVEEHADRVALLQALFLGYRAGVSAERKEVFAVTGSLHVFALSGLHVGILCALTIFGLKVLRVPRTYWVLALLPLLASYTAATGARPSVVRAGSMAILFFCAPLCGRRADALSSLSAAAVGILAITPRQLTDAGFIFSFVIVAGICVLYPRLVPMFLRPLQEDALRLQQEATPVRIARQAGRGVASLAALSLAAWLSSAPLSALYFGRVVPVALFTNLLVVPLAFLIVLTSTLSLVLGVGGDVFSCACNAVNVTLIGWFVGIANMLAHVPGGCLHVPRIPPWSVGAWYILLLTCSLFPWRMPRPAHSAEAGGLTGSEDGQ